MKRSIICGFVLSVVAFNSFAASTGTFEAKRDFTTVICSISDKGSNNRNVNILIKGEGDTVTNDAADYEISSNGSSVTWSLTTNSVNGIPQVYAPHSSFAGIPINKAAILTNQTSSAKITFDDAAKSQALDNFSGGKGELKIQPKIEADAVEFGRNNAVIGGTVSIICS